MLKICCKFETFCAWFVFVLTSKINTTDGSQTLLACEEGDTSKLEA